MRIETTGICHRERAGEVTPHVGVRIETVVEKMVLMDAAVTPHVGVRIETLITNCPTLGLNVTPHVGVRIETLKNNQVMQKSRSHLT